MAGYPVEYVTSPVLIVRSELTADDSFAAMRARSKFGIAMAAMIKIIATTISNSINEKPFCFRIVILFSVEANWSQQTDLPFLFRTFAAISRKLLSEPGGFSKHFIYNRSGYFLSA